MELLVAEDALDHGNEEAERLAVARLRGDERVLVRGENGGQRLALNVGGPQESALGQCRY